MKPVLKILQLSVYCRRKAWPVCKTDVKKSSCNLQCWCTGKLCMSVNILNLGIRWRWLVPSSYWSGLGCCKV